MLSEETFKPILLKIAIRHEDLDLHLIADPTRVVLCESPGGFLVLRAKELAHYKDVFKVWLQDLHPMVHLGHRVPIVLFSVLKDGNFWTTEALQVQLFLAVCIAYGWVRIETDEDEVPEFSVDMNRELTSEDYKAMYEATFEEFRRNLDSVKKYTQCPTAGSDN